jgi:hypothetical protein
MMVLPSVCIIFLGAFAVADCKYSFFVNFASCAYKEKNKAIILEMVKEALKADVKD